MKLECSRDQLLDVVSAAERVTSKQSPLASLHFIILSADKKSLSVKATNLDVGVEYTIPVKVEKTGSCAISGTILTTLLSNIAPSSTLAIEIIGSGLHISSPKHSTIIKTVPMDDFPNIPHIDTNNVLASITVNTQIIVQGIRSVAYAAAINDIKPEIATVYLEVQDKNIVFVATDMFRLAKKTTPLENEVEAPSHVLLPIKNAVEIARLCEKIQGDVTILYSKNECTFTTDNAYIFSRTVQGTFLDYTQAIPTVSKTTIRVAKEDLISAVRAISVFSDKFHLIHLKVLTEENLFEITSQNQDTGESVISIEGQFSGESFEMNFNARLILDCLAVIQEEQIELSVGGPQKPMSIKGVGDQTFLYVVAPLNR